MRIYDILNKKRLAKELTDEEIDFFVTESVNGNLKDYEISALLMAIAINGLTKRETLKLTLSMANSGDMIDLSEINGVCVDKHSSGGVSDTTTLILAPIVASCGVNVAKMSGRGLGFTGGTIDKLEAISGYQTAISEKDFISNVNKNSISIISQTKSVAPADKIFYSLRDQTATVESLPLIASSIMSKKLASGAKVILLDVKFGKAAFMKTEKDAEKLAKLMVEIGKGAGRKTRAVITDMNMPLGSGIGCTLEVINAINALNGEESNLSYLSKYFAATLVSMAKDIDMKTATDLINEKIENKEALNKFATLVESQGGNREQILNCDFKLADIKKDIKLNCEGFVTDIDALLLSQIVLELGGARVEVGGDLIHNVGVELNVKYGDKIEKNTIVASVYGCNKQSVDKVLSKIKKCFRIDKQKPKNIKLIRKVID